MDVRLWGLVCRAGMGARMPGASISRAGAADQTGSAQTPQLWAGGGRIHARLGATSMRPGLARRNECSGGAVGSARLG